MPKEEAQLHRFQQATQHQLSPSFVFVSTGVICHCISGHDQESRSRSSTQIVAWKGTGCNDS